jgi:hypothetical protein
MLNLRPSLVPHQQQNMFSFDLGKAAGYLLKSKEIQRVKPFEKKVIWGHLEPRERSN